MILPVLAVFIVTTVVWGLLSSVTGGYLAHVSGPITATLISLIGIRAALTLLGEGDRISYDILILNAVLLSIFMLVAKATAMILVDVVALTFAGWQTGTGLQFLRLANAEQEITRDFAVNAIGVKAILGLAMVSMVSALMAVPIASQARAAGAGTHSSHLFHGFGASFFPLFCVVAVSFFLQFFFSMLTTLHAVIPLVLSIFSLVFSQAIPNVDLELVLKGAGASFALLWLHSWVWSASALALKQLDGAEMPKPKQETPNATTTTMDLRALRKSRQ